MIVTLLPSHSHTTTEVLVRDGEFYVRLFEFFDLFFDQLFCLVP
jgi:hypothetical protein